MTDNKTKLLEEALDKFREPGFFADNDKFRSWFYQWINQVDCELNPDPWMNEPFTDEELLLIKIESK